MNRELLNTQLARTEQSLLWEPKINSPENKRIVYADSSRFGKMRIHEGLRIRQSILNQLFFCTEAEVERLNMVNTRLRVLTKMMYARAYELFKVAALNGYNPEFDDDIMVEGKLSFCWNSIESSYLAMEEDALYGSDFPAMMELQDDANYYRECASCAAVRLPVFRDGHPDLSGISPEQIGLADDMNDGTSWNEWPLNREEFAGITFCYAMHELCCHQSWAIQDVLRMNDFWCEVFVTHQHLVNLAGQRSTLIDKQ